jgi:hypothetical protein
MRQRKPLAQMRRPPENAHATRLFCASRKARRRAIDNARREAL